MVRRYHSVHDAPGCFASTSENEVLVQALKDYRDLRRHSKSSKCASQLRGLLLGVFHFYILPLSGATVFIVGWVIIGISTLGNSDGSAQGGVSPLLFVAGITTSISLVYFAKNQFVSYRRHIIRERKPGYILLALQEALSKQGNSHRQLSAGRYEFVRVVSENADWLLGIEAARLKAEMPCYIFRIGLMLTKLPPSFAGQPEVEALHEKIMELDLCPDAVPSSEYMSVWLRQRNDTQFVKWVLSRWGK